MRILIPFLIFVLFVTSCSQQPGGAITASQLEEKIKDYAHVLNDNQEKNLFHLIAGFEQEAGSEISIITIDSLLGESIDSFSSRKAKELYGTKMNSDNQILIIVVVQNKQIAIHTSSPLQRIVKNEIADRIIREDMAPRFRKNRYGSGIFVAVSKMKKIFNDNRPADREIRTYESNAVIAGR